MVQLFRGRRQPTGYRTLPHFPAADRSGRAKLRPSLPRPSRLSRSFALPGRLRLALPVKSKPPRLVNRVPFFLDREVQLMDHQKPGLPLLEQREIEARIVGPLLRAFAAELGQERALEIVGKVIRELARQSGRELAQALGESTLEAFARTLGRWSQNDALQIDILEQTPEKLSFNVTRCRYAEMYRSLGLADLGVSLSCQRDLPWPRDSTPPFNSHAHRRSWKALHTAISGSGSRRKVFGRSMRTA